MKFYNLGDKSFEIDFSSCKEIQNAPASLSPKHSWMEFGGITLRLQNGREFLKNKYDSTCYFTQLRPKNFIHKFFVTFLMNNKLKFGTESSN